MSLWKRLAGRSSVDQPDKVGHQPYDPAAEEEGDVIERDAELGFLRCRVEDLTAELKDYRAAGPVPADVAGLLDRVARAEEETARLRDRLAEVTAERDRLKPKRGQQDPEKLLARIDQLQRDNAVLRQPGGATALYLRERARADELAVRLGEKQAADMAGDQW
ncbi:hypothetical protein J5X84_36340 [Streptosporangiaceae bacterium NEAU-GS5]|nr:hypothetical protein [Streptosporangiaceae bacterium NEAU-GS5]